MGIAKSNEQYILYDEFDSKADVFSQILFVYTQKVFV